VIGWLSNGPAPARHSGDEDDVSIPPDAPSIETLLTHADWVRALAGRLVADPARADDVAQETWLAALEHPPRDARNLKGWLRAIVRNTARELGRGEKRRTQREQAVARPEASVPSSAELVQRVHLQREIAAHVIGLDEPYRTVVLLRWYEGLFPRDIALRLGRPIDTVTTQLARAHEKLRAKLDREHGERSTWSALLLDLTRPHEAAARSVATGTIGGVLVTAGWKIGIGVVAAIVLSISLWRAAAPIARETVASTERAAGSSQLFRASAPAGLGADSNARAERTSVPAPAAPVAAAVAREDGLIRVEARGRVIDERGTPLAGIRLRAYDSALPRVEEGELLDGTGHALAGRAELEQLRAQRSQIDAFVRAQASPGVREALLGQDLSVETTTDSAGWYAVSLLGVENGRIKVESIDPEWLLFLSAYERPAHSVVQIAAHAVTLAGEIVDADGELLEDAQAWIDLYLWNLRELPFDLDIRTSGMLRAACPGPGTFRFERAPLVAGWRIEVRCAGYRTVHLPIPERNDEHLRVALERAHATPSLSGIVLDAEGRPATGAVVAFGYARTLSGPDGRFTLAAKDWRPESDLVAVKSGAIAAVLPEFGRKIGANQGDVGGIALRLGGTPLTIEGRVLDAHGEPCAGWEVDVYDKTPAGALVPSVEALSAGRAEDERAHRTDAAGAFRVDGLAPRAYRLSAISSDRHLLIVSDPVLPGTSELLLRLPADAVRARVAGRVLSKHGVPIEGASVYVEGVTGRNKEGWSVGLRCPPAKTDALGRFELRDVPRYHVDLKVRADGVGETPIPLAPTDTGENLEVVIARQARFHVELAESDPADAFEVADAQGRKLTIVAHGPGGLIRTTRVPRDEAGFPACETEEDAAALVLLREGVELRRVMLTLDPDRRTAIRP
jgi:RNA polymerase sigma-70 factor (ECF subfamily)